MFHRPKTEDQTPAAADAKKPDAAPNTQAASAAPVEAKAAEVKVPEAKTPDIPASYVKPAPTEKNTTDTHTDTKTDTKSEGKAMNTPTKDEQDKQAGRSLDIPAHNPVPGTFQANQATAPRVPGTAYAYPGTAPAAAPHAAQAASSDAARSTNASGRRLIIGQGITLSGEIESCDYLVVEGTVEAALKGASVLEISENGTFYGTVEIEQATIAGCFEGDITVSGRLTITSTGSVTGSLSYKELAIEAGGIVDGKIMPLGAKADRKSDKPKKSSSHRNDNAGSELPFSGTATAN